MTAPERPEDLLTPAEVAAILRVDAKTVTRWANEGRIPSTRTPGGHHRYRRADVDAANTPTPPLNTLLARALHAAERIAFTRDGDRYTVVAYHGIRAYPGSADTPAEALGEAMRQLAAAREQAKAGA